MAQIILPLPLTAVFVRINPVNWENSIALQVEFYGCNSSDSHIPSMSSCFIYSCEHLVLLLFQRKHILNKSSLNPAVAYLDEVCVTAEFLKKSLLVSLLSWGWAVGSSKLSIVSCSVVSIRSQGISSSRPLKLHGAERWETLRTRLLLSALVEWKVLQVARMKKKV